MPYFGIPIRNGLPIGLGSVAGFGVQQFSPADLFSAGEQGAWYDPSDLTTLFDDSAGTTPVTAPGNGADVWVGLMLDKSKGGVGTNGAARYNLLTYSEDQSNAVWTNFSATQSSNVAVAPNGTTTADKIVEVAGSGGQSRYNTIAGVANVAHTASCYFKQASGTDRQYATLSVSGTGGANWFAATFDLTGAGAVVKTGAGASGTYTGSSIESVGNGWYRCVVTGLTGQASTHYLYPGPSDSANPTYGSFGVLTYTGDTSKGVLIWGADLRLASQASLTPTYQPITSSWTATIPGNHATQTTSAKRPKLAARYNLLTYTEQFDNGVWTKTAVSSTTAGQISPLGNATAVLANASGAAAAIQYYQIGLAIGNNTSYVGICYFKAGTANWAVLNLYDTIALNKRVWFDVTNGAVGNADAGCVGSITSVGNGWYRCSITRTMSSTSGGLSVEFSDANGSSAVTAGKTMYLWGADLRPASQATGLIGPTYQRVVDAATYDAVGFLPYLQFDGLSWSMSTGSIDFTATDKMTVWAGVRKLSDSSYPVITELSASFLLNNGSFAIFGSGNVTPRYPMGLTGTASPIYETQTYTPPITNILFVAYDIGGSGIADEIKPRINGILNQTNPSGASAGTGNFGNYPLFIGARNNASLFFTGWLTSLIIRGAQSTQGQIEATESWVNGKTGAF
jgi:hypothetical protein